MADFDFSEFRQLAADLNGAGARVDALARTAVAATATMLQAQAQGAAPVDTGFLRSSISTTNRGLEAEVGPTASYGYFVEGGTSRMSPQPYLFPALDVVTPMFEAAMAQVIEQAMP